MSRSSSSSSSDDATKKHTNRLNNTRHRRTMPTLFKRNRSAKKQLSLFLNNADFEICHAPNENEMFESMSNFNTQGNNNTNQSESSTSDNTISDQLQTAQDMYTVSSTMPHKKRLISHIKHRLSPYKYDSTQKNENNHEKNRGFLLIDEIDSDLVLIPSDNIDQQSTRHAEPCQHGQIDEDNLDINQIQLISTTPVTPSLLPPQQLSLTPTVLPLMNHSSTESDVQATQAGVECAMPNFDQLNVHDTQLSATDSTSSSTNSSYNDPQWTNDDRMTLDDTAYVQQQKHDLERITIYEIALNNDRRDYLQDLPQNEKDELEFNHHYKDALQKNTKLKQKLKQIEDESARMYSPWSCEVCTYINEPYIKTGKDICDMCEGPSPLKRHALTS